MMCMLRDMGEEVEGICVGGGPESQGAGLNLFRPGQPGLIGHGISDSELDCKMCNVSAMRAGCQSGGIIHSTWPSLVVLVARRWLL
jgi:hypothetical protein